MRLYHWTDPQDTDRMLLTARIANPDDAVGRRTFTGVPLSTDPPPASSEEHSAAVDIPSEIIELFRVRAGRYLVPASVVRAYQALREQQ